MGCSCSDYRISHDCSMVVSAFAEETQGQVQAKSYDLTFNKKTTGVFGRGVSYEGISLEGKTYDEAVSEINEYANDRLTRYMQWDVLGYKYDYDGSSFSTTWTNLMRQNHFRI